MDTPPDARIAKIARLTIENNSDVAFYQELWGKWNKQKMIEGLKPAYKYILWNENNTPGAKNMTELDDGIMIASKRPPFFTKEIIFSDRTGDEDNGIRGSAKKGALFMGICDAAGKPILLITSHLQSGTSMGELEVRMKQCAQIAEMIKTIYQEFPSTQDGQIIMAGDFNDPVGWREFAGDAKYPKEVSRIVDRTKQLTDVFRLKGIPLSNDWLIKRMAATYHAEEILEVFQQEGAGVIKDGKGAFKYTVHVKPGLDKAKAPAGSYAVVESAKGPRRGSDAPVCDTDMVGQLNGGDFRWRLFPEATDPDRIQILDHIFILEERTVVKQWVVDRKRFLGDRDQFTGQVKHLDSKTALADHAAILATLSGR